MRVTVAAWIGSANAGDELIFAALRRKLLARGARVTALSASPAAGARHTVASFGHLSARAVADATVSGDAVTSVGHLSPRAVGAIASSDALVFGGGGLLQDQTSPFNLPYHLSRLQVARLARTPRAVVGVGAGPLRTAIGRVQVRDALRGATAVSVRDHGSRETLAGAGVPGVRLAADLALSLPSPTIAAADTICACLRPWRAVRGRLPVRLRARRDVTPDGAVVRLARGLDAAAAALGMPVRLVALQSGWDDLLHARVADRMRAPVTLLSPPPDRVVDTVAASRIVVAMRYHAGIAAVLAGRPATLIGYDPKLAGLAAAMGPAGRLVAWAPAALDQLAHAVVAVSEHDDGLGAVLADLRARERTNDVVLDDLLSVAEDRR